MRFRRTLDHVVAILLCSALIAIFLAHLFVEAPHQGLEGGERLQMLLYSTSWCSRSQLSLHGNLFNAHHLNFAIIM